MMRELLIYRVYDTSNPDLFGYLDISPDRIHILMADGTGSHLMKVIEAVAAGSLILTPGHYFLLEAQPDLTQLQRGAIFRVTERGDILQGYGTDSSSPSLRLTTWPPKAPKKSSHNQ